MQTTQIELYPTEEVLAGMVLDSILRAVAFGRKEGINRGLELVQLRTLLSVIQKTRFDPGKTFWLWQRIEVNLGILLQDLAAENTEKEFREGVQRFLQEL